MTEDAELLRRYADDSSQEAFAELVRRHVDFVYAAALRQGRNAHRAEDVTQMVFTDLARKAPALSRRTELVGWLYTSARYATNHLIRSDARRQAREQEAVVMERDTFDPAMEIDWQRLQPVLDHALQGLSERDRSAILLRFFKNRSFAEIGAVLGLNDDAARRRVDRALEKLHGILGRRGIGSTAAALATLLAGHPLTAAPAGLAASVTSSALASAVTTPAISVLQFMSTTKIATGVAGVILLLTFGVAWKQVQADQKAQSSLSAANQNLGGLLARQQELKQRALALEQGQADLQKNVAAAQAGTQKPTAPSGAGAGGGRANVPPEEQIAAGNAFLALHPEVKQALLDRSRARVDARYRPLYRALGLTPAQIEQFENLLIEGEGVNMGTPAGQIILRPGTGLNQDEVNSRVHDLLGDDGYQQYQEATRLVSARGFAAQVAGALYFTDTPLSVEQSAQLTQLVDTTRTETRQTHGSGDDYWNIVIGKAESFLSKPQLAALAGFQQQEQFQRDLAQVQVGWQLPGWGQPPKTATPPKP